jgi:hypothetical protein
MDAANKSAEMVGVKVGVNTKGITDALEAFEAAGKSTTKVITETFSDENLKELGGKFTDAVAEGFANDTLNQTLSEEFTAIGNKFNTTLLSAMDELPDLLEEGNIFKEEGLIRTFITNIDNIGTSMTELSGIFGASLLNTDINSIDQTLSNSDENTLERNISQDVINENGDNTSVAGNDVLLRPGKPDIFLNPDDITFLAGTDLLGEKPNGLNGPNLGMDMLKGLSNIFTSRNTEGSLPREATIKITYDGPGIPITFEGETMSELTPMKVREITQTDEFFKAVKSLVVPSNNYGEVVN